MALTRQQKQEAVAQSQENIEESVAAVFVAFNGLSLADMNELRNKLYEQSCSMRVIPKRLLKIALANSNVAFDPTIHEGQIALVWGNDAVAPAKVIHEFAKGRENISLQGGVLEGDLVSQEQVTSLAQLPNREQLIGQLLSVLNGPARGFVQVLSGVPRSAVYVLQAIKEAKE